MRVIVADCSAEYSGRLNASLPLAKRVLLIKADSSLLIFSELGSYKPLNWMTAPCTIREIDPAAKSAQHSRESGAQRVSGASLDECAAGCEAVEHTGFGERLLCEPHERSAEYGSGDDAADGEHNALQCRPAGGDDPLVQAIG